MHDSSAMPFIHIGLVAILVLAFVGMVVVKQVKDRKARHQGTDASEATERKHV